MCQNHLSTFQFAHLQHIINQCQKMIGCYQHFLPVFIYLFSIVRMLRVNLK